MSKTASVQKRWIENLMEIFSVPFNHFVIELIHHQSRKGLFFFSLLLKVLSVKVDTVLYMNTSLSSGVVGSALKLAVVKPLL